MGGGSVMSRIFCVVDVEATDCVQINHQELLALALAASDANGRALAVNWCIS